MRSLFDKTPFEQVQEFQITVLGVAAPAVPEMLDPMRIVNGRDCLIEEIGEFMEAADRQDIVGMADALADLIYFAYGIAHKMGLPFDAIWNMVHHANMTKLRGVTRRHMAFDAIKPAGWVDPKLAIQELINSLQRRQS